MYCTEVPYTATTLKYYTTVLDHGTTPWHYTMILHHDTTPWYYTMILHHSTRLKIPLFSIAVYFENENNYLSAGKFYLLSEYYERALKLFMRCSSATKDSEHIILAIDTVGQVWVEKKIF